MCKFIGGYPVFAHLKAADVFIWLKTDIINPTYLK